MPGIGITATRNDEPGTFEFVLDNSVGNIPMNFFINLQYLNAGAGSQLSLYYRFDDESRMPLAGTKGPDLKHQLQAMFHRDAPFKRLTFIMELNCKGDTAQYHGGNLETLAFRNLEVFVCPSGDTASCQADWERHNIESQRLNYNAEGFLTSSSTPNIPQWNTASNLLDTPSQEENGWGVLTPQDPDKPALLTVELEPGTSTVYYPRLSGSDASLQIFEIQADGSRRPVVIMAGVPVVWTPLGARYPLVLPEGPAKKILQFELRGRYCQLWHKGEDIFF
jgi:hypothetical protein